MNTPSMASSRGNSEWNAKRFRRAGLTVFGGGVLFFLVLPILVVAVASLDPGEFFTFPPSQISLRWYQALLVDESWRSALLLSLKIASLTTLASTFIGTLAGIAIARTASKPRVFLYGLLVVPLVLPAVLLAISFSGVILRLHLVGNLLAFVVGNTVLSAPLVALLVRGAALGVDRRLEYASLACGAGPWRTLRLVTIPLVAPAAIAGGVFAFLSALGDVVMSIFIAAPGREPLAVRMFEEALKGTSPKVTAASTLLIIAPWAALLMLALLRWLTMTNGQQASGGVLEMITSSGK